MSTLFTDPSKGLGAALHGLSLPVLLEELCLMLSTGLACVERDAEMHQGPNQAPFAAVYLLRQAMALAVEADRVSAGYSPEPHDSASTTAINTERA